MPRVLALVLFLFAARAHAATLLVFGDSLSAGFGLAAEQSWPSLLAQRIEARHLPYEVVNASISGETTAGGRARLPAALQRYRPAVVVIELGANDGLRGLPLDQAQANLAAMAHAARRAGARVLLIGMRLPPNYGPDYTRDFAAMFATVARAEKAALLPFLLEPIARDDAAFQPDRLHPVAAAQPRILDHVWQALQPLLKRH